MPWPIMLSMFSLLGSVGFFTLSLKFPLLFWHAAICRPPLPKTWLSLFRFSVSVIRQLLRLTACLSSCLLLNLKQTTLKHLKNKKCKKWVMPASSGPVPSPEWLAFTCQLVHPVFSWALGSEGKQTVGHPRSSPSGSHWLYKRFAFPFSLHPCGAEIDAESVCGWCEGSLLLPASRK